MALPGAERREPIRAPGVLHPAALVYPISQQRKIAPIWKQPYDGPGRRRFRPVAIKPYATQTYAAIAATCPDTCRFKIRGCFVREGFTGPLNRRLEANARERELTALDVIREEAAAIDATFPDGVPQDGSRGGRDIRVHVGGDVSCADGASLLAGACVRWMERGGGLPWTYTHRWRSIPRAAFGVISVLASVETDEEAREALEAGTERLSHPRHGTISPSHPGTFRRREKGRSPAETRGTNCVSCRLCFDADGLRERGSAIGFAIHGPIGRADGFRRRLPLVTSDAGFDLRGSEKLSPRGDTSFPIVHESREVDPNRRKKCGVCGGVGHNKRTCGGSRAREIRDPWLELELHEHPEAIRIINAHPDGMTLEEVGDVIGVTRERVRQIEAVALTKIREGLDLDDVVDVDGVAVAIRDCVDCGLPFIRRGRMKTCELCEGEAPREGKDEAPTSTVGAVEYIDPDLSPFLESSLPFPESSPPMFSGTGAAYSDE